MKPTALTAFKKALQPGAKFEVDFEETVIRGNTQTNVLRTNTQPREVLRVTSKRVIFKGPRGETRFDFPPAKEIIQDGTNFCWINQEGKKQLTYRPV